MFFAFPSACRLGREEDLAAFAGSAWREPRFFFLVRLRLRPGFFSLTLTMASRPPKPRKPRSGSWMTSISRRLRSVMPSSRIAASMARSIVFALTSTYATSAPSAPALLLRARLRLLAIGGVARLGRLGRFVAAGCDWSGPAVDLEDQDLLAGPEEIASSPVEHQTSREVPGDEADEQRHDLGHRRLGTRLGPLRLGLSVVLVPGLDVLRGHHQDDHEQVGEGGHEPFGERLGGRPGQMHPQEIGVALGDGLAQGGPVGQPP